MKSKLIRRSLTGILGAGLIGLCGCSDESVGFIHPSAMPSTNQTQHTASAIPTNTSSTDIIPKEPSLFESHRLSDYLGPIIDIEICDINQDGFKDIIYAGSGYMGVLMNNMAQVNAHRKKYSDKTNTQAQAEVNSGEFPSNL